jgi:hypothetical protein
MKRTIALALAGLALAACGHAPVNRGTVDGRQFIPAYTDIIMEPILSTRCSAGSCTEFIAGYIAVPVHHDDDWQLDIRNDKQFRWVSVTQDDYNRHQIGSHWVRLPSES